MRLGTSSSTDSGWTADRVEEYRKHGTDLRQGNTVLWEFHQNDRSVREVLKRGNRYRLVELLKLDGGKTEEVSRIR